LLVIKTAVHQRRQPITLGPSTAFSAGLRSGPYHRRG